MTYYDYGKFVHPVPAGHTVPKGTQVRSVDSAPHIVDSVPYIVETFFTTQYDHPLTPSGGVKYYLDYDITKPKLPEKINSVIYNVRATTGAVYPVAVYQGTRVWCTFSENGGRMPIYTPEIESFDLTPKDER